LELEETAAALQMKLAEQEYARDIQAIELNRFSRYNDFMQQVQAESPDEYSDIPAIEARYGMLQSAIAAAEADAEQYKAQVAHETQQLSRLRGTLERAKLELQNEFDMLKQQQDTAKQHTDELLAAADEASTSKGDKLLEFGQVLQTVGHLHTRCMGSHHRDIIKHKHTSISDDDLVHGRVALPSRHEPEAAAAATSGSSAQRSNTRAGGRGGGGQAPNQALQELLLAGRRNARGGSLLSDEEQQRMSDFLQLKGDVVAAMQQLEVVGHYIFDFARLVTAWESTDKHTWSASAAAGEAAAGAAAGLTSPIHSSTVRRASGAGGAAPSRSLGASSLGRSRAGGASVRHGAAGSNELSGSSKVGSSVGASEWQLKRPGLTESAGLIGSTSRVAASHSTS